MKRNEKISDNDAHKNAIKGSTMIAVLAAMLFIGVVTASMVKNTGSQSAASVGYGTMQTMSSTVRSGIVATETYFLNENNLNNLRAKMDLLLNAETSDKESKKPFILGSGDKKKAQLAANQHFSCRVSEFDEANRNPRYVRFEVNAGRSEGGKNLKKAFAYYTIDNHFNQITIESDDFGGSNSFTASENGRVDAGNSGAVFHGHATFEHGLLLQNDRSVSFVKDANGEGSVYVTGTTQINNSEKVTFEVDAYFDDDVIIQNIPDGYEMFQKNAGFKSDLKAENKTIKFGGDVWYNGDFLTQNSNGSYSTHNTTKLEGNYTNSKIYYTNKIPMQSSNFDGCVDGACPIHTIHINGSYHPDDVKKSKIMVTNSFVNRDLPKDDSNSPVKYGQSEITDIPAKMKAANVGTAQEGKGMTTIDERKEPDIDVKNIADGKQFLSISDPKVKILNSNGQLDGAVLQKFYEDTKDDANFKDYYDNGHLLLKIPEGRTLTASGGGEFNGKVIFDVEGDVNASGNFYKSGKDASTLLYVGKNGKLDQFGVGANGTFQGLVYIDKDNKYNGGNNGQHTFSWGKDSQIQGAVIIKGGNLIWNSSSSVMDIYRNNDVLKNYAFLKGGESEGKKKTTVEHENRGLKLCAFGYYFY